MREGGNKRFSTAQASAAPVDGDDRTRDGDNYNDIIETAIDYTNFKQWVQTHEYKLEDKAFVENVLQEPLNYKLP